MVEAVRERDARDGCSHTAMFGNGIGEKKHRINEMAAYYRARAAVVFIVFLPIQLFSMPLIRNVCRVHIGRILCAHMYLMHIIENIALCVPPCLPFV